MTSQQRHVESSRQLIERNFAIDAGQLVIDGRAIQSLAAEFGTPLYVYRQSLVERAWRDLRNAYPSNVRILFSMKANPHPNFLKFFLTQGAGIEIASAGEMQSAVSAGADPQDIVFAGPGKTDSQLTFAVQSGVGEIHAESIGEVRRIAAIASSEAIQVNVALRVNPNTAAEGAAAMRMGGRPSAFGIDEDQLPEVVQAVTQNDWINFVGLHLNTGTQLLDVDAIVSQYEYASQLAVRIGKMVGSPLPIVNLGGGLGIPYFAGQEPLPIDQLTARLQTWMSANEQDSWLKDVQWVIEPGRYLVGECGMYVTSVVDVKSSRGETFVVMDGGMHHHLAASGNFGQTIKRPFPLALANRLDKDCAMQATLVGPLCTPLDTLGRKVLVPDCAEGDLVVILQSGAYALTASPLEFLSHSRPVELWSTPSQIARMAERPCIPATSRP